MQISYHEMLKYVRKRGNINVFLQHHILEEK